MQSYFPFAYIIGVTVAATAKETIKKHPFFGEWTVDLPEPAETEERIETILPENFF